MKRNLNENSRLENELDLEKVVKICVSSIREDDDTMDCNELRDIFVNAGAHVEGSHGILNGEPATIMTVVGLSKERVEEILQNFLDESELCGNAEDYIESDEIEDIENEFPAYEDVDLDPETDSLNDDELFEGDNILDDAREELTSVLAQVDDEIYLSDEGVVLDTVLSEDNLRVYSIQANGDMETDEDEVVNAYDLTDADDIFTLCDVIKDALEFDAQYPEYDDVEIDDEDEVKPRFEKMGHHRHLDEKKKNDCCPGTGKVNESIIDLVIADLDKQILNEEKQVNEDSQSKLQTKVLKALKENAHSLYPNVRYNGKSFDKMTIVELRSLYKTIQESVNTLSDKVLNENVKDQKSVDNLENKKKLLEFIDNEITYRTTRLECLKKLNEDGAEISDEELANLFGPAQGEDSSSSDNTENNSEESSKEENTEENKEENKEESSEENEEVELARIEITLKDEQAAKDLKQACLDADIPEDAIELENVNEDEEAFDNDESSEENTEESTEETQEDSSEEASDESANESYEYADYVKMLLEDEAPAEESSEENNEESTEETPEESSEETSDENSDENKEDEDNQPKFILTNTDYAFKLAKVLEDMYGISKDEFEEMIGGKIVEDESDENSDENKEENSEENKEDGDKSSDENSEEEIDPSDLFKNL